MMPIFNFLGDYLERKSIELLLKEGKIITLPLAYQRGLSFNNSFVVLDECLPGYAMITGVRVDGLDFEELSLSAIGRHLKTGRKIEVLSYSNTIEYNEVTHFFENGEKQLYKITIGEDMILATQSHPFATYKGDKIEWVKLSDLEVGDYLLQKGFSGKEKNLKDIHLVKIDDIEIDIIDNVFNIEVANNNNYFTDGILVHNCQNTTPSQMRMFLTRTGENCKVVATGDPDQSDIRGRNGLVHAMQLFEGEKDIEVIKFNDDDIVRSEIVRLIENKYRDSQKNFRG